MAFFKAVKQCGHTTGPVEPVNGINKDVCDTKLYPTAVLVYPVDCDCLCHLLDTQYCCLYLNGSLNPPSAAHPPLPPPTPSHPPTPLYVPFVIFQ